MLASEFIVEYLIGLGVRHVFGVGGANIEDMFSAVQKRRPAIAAILDVHEHAAGTAADAYARLRGLGAVMTTSGGGAMNLVHAIAESRAAGVPVLAIVGEPPRALQGCGAFQDTSGRGGTVDARAVFEAVSARCFRVGDVDQLPSVLSAATDILLGDAPGPVVLLVAKDIQHSALTQPATTPTRLPSVAGAAPDDAVLRKAGAWLRSRPVLIIAGPDVARANAREELALLAARVDARVATTPDGRDAFDNGDGRFIGVAGSMGHDRVQAAVRAAALVVAVGTRLPQLARQGLEAALAERMLLAVADAPPFVTAAALLHVPGNLRAALRALSTLTPEAPPGTRRADAQTDPSDADSAEMTTAQVLAAIDRSLPSDGVLLIDAGNTGASGLHYVRAPRDGRAIVAMGMAGMGYTFGAATGSAFATGKRCVAVAGDGAFFMNGLEIHTAVEHALPITYVVLNNRAHGMCLVRERLLLGEHGGYNAFRASHIGAGAAAMFPGLCAADCSTPSEFAALFQASLGAPGPTLIGVELAEVEVPPFALFQQQAPNTTVVPREVGHD
jgi:acetolactate synthase-1/2/3 large subunit